MNRFAFALSLVLPIALAGASSALVIDEFDGFQSLEIRPGTRALRSTAAGAMLGGSRDIRIFDTTFATFGTAAVHRGKFTYTTSGSTMGTDFAFSSYDIDPARPPVDLTDGGLATGFLLDIADVEGRAAVWVGVTDDDGVNTRWLFNMNGFLTNPGPALIAFQDHSTVFPTLADMTRIRALNLRVWTAGQGRISIDSLQTVPEGTPSLLLTFAFAVWATRRGIGRRASGHARAGGG